MVLNKKRIGIDLDSTLNNLDEMWLQKYNEEYNDNIKEFKEWDVEKLVKPECGKKIFNYLHEPNFFYNLDILPDAKKVVDFLAEHYELYIVTAYSPDTCLDKANWVKKQNLKVNQKNIIFINNKGLLDLDYLIDDGPHNFENFKGVGLIFNMPYNKHMKENSTRRRVNNWKDIKKFFENEVKSQVVIEKEIKTMKNIIKYA